MGPIIVYILYIIKSIYLCLRPLRHPPVVLREMSFQYSKLPEGSIRVVHLLPGEDAVNVELSVRKLNDKEPVYDALSWQWGSISYTGENTINIRNEGNNDFHQMLVRPNLLWALKSIRRLPPNAQPNKLWVDFICINQNDLEERASQVARMTEIYQGARRVHVWLGKPGHTVDPRIIDDFTDEELKIAVQHIDTIWNLDDANHIGSVDIGIRNKANLHNLEPLFKLLKRGWFSRRWIVQEVGVARDTIVHCGDRQFEWEKLTHAIALLERIGRDGSIDRLFKLRPDTRHVSEYVGNISALPAFRLVQNVSGLHRQLSRKSRSKQYTLEQLICFLVIFESSEPKDIVYAVLGIASDVRPTHGPRRNALSCDSQTNPGPTDFPVRYDGEETLDLYIRFLKHAMQKSRSLDILCRPWAPEGIKLPSWILDVTRKPFRATSRGKMVRYNPDPFVGPVIRGKYYTASGHSINNQDWFFKIRSDGGDGNPKVIVVRGFKIAKPVEMWDLAVHGSIPASWLSGVNWEDSKRPPPEEFWRTIVADRTSAGLEPEPGYSSIIQSAVVERGVHYGINTNEFIHEKDNSAYFEVFRRVQAVVWNRKLIRAELLCDGRDNCHDIRYDRCPDGGYDGDHETERPLGLVPAMAEKGDSIYIVDGCSVPLVLRPKDQKADGTATYYELVGECYINNMMDGRAMGESPKWEDIKIK
ncbi:heterokaryon incompatibility protein-domain-containing protein [Hypoxylon trugodes]|uniref:heterokaryon incompatibility protein-domain-containing protein n=1 Tax=Hypoxylon trugodes TaxID=326681 RepID=UPI0021908758|nr:heterokaryon incompatibility protein-domain-containing protein [Hypoxylon trugodes]KAI1387639.1 heterokaryon incompatibility protein-domain-containing protein [Hypoxylon trugodes]